jgi:DNA recombination protein RmuC
LPEASSVILPAVEIALLVVVIVLLLALKGNQSGEVLARIAELKTSADKLDQSVRDEIRAFRTELSQQAQNNRQEAAADARALRDELASTVVKFGTQTDDKLDQARKQQAEASVQLSESVQTNVYRLSKDLRETNLQFNDTLQQRLTDIGNRFNDLITAHQSTQETLRNAIEARLDKINESNAQKLEEMRHTVDEKLQGTLEKRLGESFQLVSERLEQVHKGLGEMQNLASGVGDLKRVLTNVKTRGTWGEMQLGNLLDQILAPEQYARNVRTKPTGLENVEFAIKLPGRDEQDGKCVWLPIDAKFPKEDYERLVDAAERGDAGAVDQAAKALDNRIRSQARDIRDKYLAPPQTTDFGLLYLPTEGLYAEVIRRPGLADAVQRECRVVIVGPTTLAALLNSLQMGFRTLAIQKRSGEVWKVLGAVKTEFGKFGDVLDKVKRKLDETGNTIEEAAHRSRQLEKKLKKVEALPAAEAANLIDDGGVMDDENLTGTDFVNSTAARL